MIGIMPANYHERQKTSRCTVDRLVPDTSTGQHTSTPFLYHADC